MTPAPMTTTRGFLPIEAVDFVPFNAAPFAGMTQTGSTGLISAAWFGAAPLADAQMMGVLPAFGKTRI
jgi:hypothetical protein